MNVKKLMKALGKEAQMQILINEVANAVLELQTRTTFTLSYCLAAVLKQKKITLVQAISREDLAAKLAKKDPKNKKGKK